VVIAQGGAGDGDAEILGCPGGHSNWFSALRLAPASRLSRTNTYVVLVRFLACDDSGGTGGGCDFPLGRDHG
jgi:hypothetical protein